VIDERLDESSVVAVAPPELERLAEALLPPLAYTQVLQARDLALGELIEAIVGQRLRRSAEAVWRSPAARPGSSRPSAILARRRSSSKRRESTASGSTSRA
jgi:hypothetical protein